MSRNRELSSYPSILNLSDGLSFCRVIFEISSNGCVYVVIVDLQLCLFVPSQISGADFAIDGFIKVSGRRPEEGTMEIPFTQMASNGHAKAD